MGHKPWREIRATASAEALEGAERIVSGWVEVERQLRERLRGLAADDNPDVIIAAFSEVSDALLPWILELVEEREWMAGNLTERLP